MGPGYLSSPFEFLIDTLLGLYIMALMLRFILAWVRADFYNPASQFIVKITNPPVMFVRRFIPSMKGIDFSIIALIFGLQAISIILIMLLQGGGFSLPSIFIMSIVKIIAQGFNILTFSLIIQALLSWMSPGQANPISGLLHAINNPLLQRVRQIIPPFSGLDLSVLFALIFLQVLKMLVLPPLMYLL